MFKPKAWWEIYEVLAASLSQEQAAEEADVIYRNLVRAGYLKKAATERVE